MTWRVKSMRLERQEEEQEKEQKEEQEAEEGRTKAWTRTATRRTSSFGKVGTRAPSANISAV